MRPTKHVTVKSVLISLSLLSGGCADEYHDPDFDDKADSPHYDDGHEVAIVAAPLTATPTGFYYPVDGMRTDDGNYLACGAAYDKDVRHLGTDIIKPLGTPVFAVASGTVIARSGPAQSSGWGVGLYALAIRSESTEGHFVTVFGHITTSLSVGAVVNAGQQIGTIGDYHWYQDGRRIDGADHLHFGIRTSSTVPASGWGRIADVGCRSPSVTNGFVAPVTFIRTKRPKPAFLPIPVGTTTIASVGLGAEKRYAFPMLVGRSYVVTLQPTSGDPDLYTSNSALISTTNYQCRPHLAGNAVETCRFLAPFSGLNYVMVRGFSAASYRLTVSML